MPRKESRKKTPKKMYWDEPSVSKWIVQYNSETDEVRRNQIFEDHLYLPFKRLAEAVVCAHRTNDNNLMNADEMQTELVTHGVSKLHLYNGSGNAFGYYNKTMRNHLWLLNMKSFERAKNFPSIELYANEHGEHDYIEEQAEQPTEENPDGPTSPEFIEYLKVYWEKNLEQHISTKSNCFDACKIILGVIFSGEWLQFTGIRGAKYRLYGCVREKFAEKYGYSPPPQRFVRAMKAIRRVNCALYREYRRTNTLSYTPCTIGIKRRITV